VLVTTVHLISESPCIY